MRPRATFWAAAAAVLSLVSPGAWGAWHGTGARNASLAAASLGYSLSGTHVVGGGAGYRWASLLALLSATDHFSITNTGDVKETIRATASVTGLTLGTATLYGCTSPFTGTSCSTGRVTLNTGAGTFTLANQLNSGSTYYIAVHYSALLAVAPTIELSASSFTITPIGGGANRTTG